MSREFPVIKKDPSGMLDLEFFTEIPTTRSSTILKTNL